MTVQEKDIFTKQCMYTLFVVFSKFCKHLFLVTRRFFYNGVFHFNSFNSDIYIYICITDGKYDIILQTSHIIYLHVIHS